MKNLLPDIEPPITLKDCIERLFWVRDHIYGALGAEYVNLGSRLKKPDLFDLPGRFQSDKELRVSTADMILAAILWIEAGRPPQEIVAGCTHEIKDQCVYTLNIFLDWLLNKPGRLQDKRIDQGSMASAWIRQFAEFRKDLENNNPKFWRKP